MMALALTISGSLSRSSSGAMRASMRSRRPDSRSSTPSSLSSSGGEALCIRSRASRMMACAFALSSSLTLVFFGFFLLVVKASRLSRTSSILASPSAFSVSTTFGFVLLETFSIKSLTISAAEGPAASGTFVATLAALGAFLALLFEVFVLLTLGGSSDELWGMPSEAQLSPDSRVLNASSNDSGPCTDFARSTGARLTGTPIPLRWNVRGNDEPLRTSCL
mmetsp:Transcript_92577/g.215103  ORF Transcript_92577/g.215103 Transcript_92577/m.215103 type:complete len:221 (+) Transcript_92577:899-1561(+)